MHAKTLLVLISASVLKVSEERINYIGLQNQNETETLNNFIEMLTESTKVSRSFHPFEGCGLKAKLIHSQNLNYNYLFYNLR